MKIGAYLIHSLETGRFALDGGAMFGVVPKTLWSKSIDCDAKNRIDMAMRVLLVLFEDRRILVDVGAGHKFSEKMADIYRLDYGQFSLEKSLAHHGLSPRDITDVVLTHCHFDHVGGATEYVGEKLSLTFSEATHYIQKSHWDWALKPTERDRASFLQENLEPLARSHKLRILDGPTELFPGFHLLIANGHTVGLQMVKIQDGPTTIFYCSDLLPTASHVPLPYIMGYDLFPLTTLEEKRSFLRQASDERWVIALEHDARYPAIRIKEGPKGFETEETLEV